MISNPYMEDLCFSVMLYQTKRIMDHLICVLLFQIHIQRQLHFDQKCEVALKVLDLITKMQDLRDDPSTLVAIQM